MNHSINFDSDWGLHTFMSDLGVEYALAPFYRIGFNIDDRGIQTLAERYQSRVFRARKWYDKDQDKLDWVTLLLRFDEGAYCIAHGEGRDWAEVIAPDRDQAERLHTELREALRTEAKPGAPAFYMLRYDYGSFTAEPIENIPDPVTDEFLQLCYGEDVLTWVSGFSERTAARTGGLTILDGPPGTGKTSLITQMIRKLDQTHVFYVLPASQDDALSSPELLPFWQKQNERHADRVKVIVMEDAERLLWRRDGDNREAVSSLLNIADGLIGRMLRLHVVCSVNARMEDLDSAILRPGRLMNHRRFSMLNRDTAERIARMRNIAFRPTGAAEAYSLAEVLNPNVCEPPAGTKCIGFQPANG